MTKRTTDEWQTLLDGVAEVPWGSRQDGHDPVWMIGRLGDNPARIVGTGYGEDNARLLAAAPEAVAEVVRLRRALEELRALYIKADYPDGDDWEKGKAHAYRRVLRYLARILEGDTDG